MQGVEAVVQAVQDCSGLTNSRPGWSTKVQQGDWLCPADESAAAGVILLDNLLLSVQAGYHCKCAATAVVDSQNSRSIQLT